MCEFCTGEHRIPTGGGAEIGREPLACARQIAESLRDAIRCACPTVDTINGAEIDRCIEAFVDRCSEPLTRG